mgnify:CR=1 FL=1
MTETMSELLEALYSPEEEDSEGEETEGEKTEEGEAEGTGDEADSQETQESSEQKEGSSEKTVSLFQQLLMSGLRSTSERISSFSSAPRGCASISW